MPIIKLASSDMNDWFLIEKIAKTRKPVICSTGGSSLKDLDDLVTFFENRNIPLAINHCVSLYPCEDGDLELNQIDFLREPLPGHDIGFSTHEYHDWDGAHADRLRQGRAHLRAAHRHRGRRHAGLALLQPCPRRSTPGSRRSHRAKDMCGGSGETRRTSPTRGENKYLNTLVRGVYAKRDLPEGHVLQQDSRATSTSPSRCKRARSPAAS